MLPSFCAHFHLPPIKRCQCAFSPLQEFQCSHGGSVAPPGTEARMGPHSRGYQANAVDLPDVLVGYEDRADVERKQNIPDKQHYRYTWQVFTYPPYLWYFPL